MTTTTYLDEHRRTRTLRHAASPHALAARSAHRITGLRIDTDGRLTGVTVPAVATGWALWVHVTERAAPHCARATMEQLDTDLALWFDDSTGGVWDGEGEAVVNPVAAVVSAMFGRPGPVRGPVVLTGWVASTTGGPVEHAASGACLAGRVADIPVAAVIVVAGAARSCDLPDPGVAQPIDRAAEFARLGVHIVPALDASGPDTPAVGVPAQRTSGKVLTESYDALAHTVTRDGDWPRCAECWEPTEHGHPEHQPEALADAAADDNHPTVPARG